MEEEAPVILWWDVNYRGRWRGWLQFSLQELAHLTRATPNRLYCLEIPPVSNSITGLGLGLYPRASFGEDKELTQVNRQIYHMVFSLLFTQMGFCCDFIIILFLDTVESISQFEIPLIDLSYCYKKGMLHHFQSIFLFNVLQNYQFKITLCQRCMLRVVYSAPFCIFYVSEACLLFKHRVLNKESSVNLSLLSFAQCELQFIFLWTVGTLHSWSSGCIT